MKKWDTHLKSNDKSNTTQQIYKFIMKIWGKINLKPHRQIADHLIHNGRVDAIM